MRQQVSLLPTGALAAIQGVAGAASPKDRRPQPRSPGGGVRHTPSPALCTPHGCHPSCSNVLPRQHHAQAATGDQHDPAGAVDLGRGARGHRRGCPLGVQEPLLLGALYRYWVCGQRVQLRAGGKRVLPCRGGGLGGDGRGTGCVSCQTRRLPPPGRGCVGCRKEVQGVDTRPWEHGSAWFSWSSRSRTLRGPVSGACGVSLMRVSCSVPARCLYPGIGLDSAVGL